MSTNHQACGFQWRNRQRRGSRSTLRRASEAMTTLSRLRAATSFLRFPFSSRGCFGCPTRSVQMRVLPLTSVGGLLRDSHRSTPLHRQPTHISLFQNADHQLSGKALPSRPISLHFGLDSPQIINPQHASGEGVPVTAKCDSAFHQGGYEGRVHLEG